MEMKAAIYQNIDGTIWKELTCFFINREDYSTFRQSFYMAKFVDIDNAFETWSLDGFEFHVHIR